jgi:hypothetical protein
MTSAEEILADFDRVAESASDFAVSIPAIPWNFMLGLWEQHRLRSPREVRLMHDRNPPA